MDDIETELQQRGGSEVTTDALGAAVMDRLRELDPVGYIRFASVYRQFQEIESFETAVRDLRDGNQQLPLLDNAPAPSRSRRPGPPPRRIDIRHAAGRPRRRCRNRNRRTRRI